MSSCFGCAEACIAWVDEQWNVPRKTGALWVSGLAWGVGILTIMSLSDWSEFYPLGFIPAFEGMDIFTTLDFFAANILLLVGGLLTAIFFGWRVPKAVNLEAIGIGEGLFFSFVKFMLRYVIPVVLVVALIMGITE